MARATLWLTIPRAVWIGRLSRDYPDARIRILAALADGAAGVGLAEIECDAIGPFLDSMAAAESVTDLQVLREVDETALVQFETTLPLLLLAARDSGVPLELPFAIVDGEARWTVTASRDRLSTLGDQLEAVGVPYAVERIGSESPRESLLTERLERLLAAAIEQGYYDTPRGCTLTELAESEGLAKSTVSEILHRVEGSVLKRYASERTADVTSVAREDGRPY